MVRKIYVGVICLLAAMVAPVWSQVVPGEYIVVLHDDVDSAAVAREYALGHGAVPEHVYRNALKGFSVKMPSGLVKAIANDPRVKFVEANQLMYAIGRKPIVITGKPDKPGGGKPPKDDPPSQPAQVLPAGIDRVDADSSSANIDGIDERVDADIAVIDTGVSDQHPDLNFYTGITISRGRISSGGVDDNGHGSHVAGIAAALDNEIGVVGVAPGARIWSVKVLNRKGVGYVSDIIMGVDYVMQNAAEIEVANMSLGGGISQALDDAVENSIAAGVVYVASAGNEASDASTSSPARAPNAITVSAISDFDGLPGGLDPTVLVDSNGNYYYDDAFAAFSNYGSLVDIAAPGVLIYSTYKGSDYAEMSGTSMAAPHVAGAVALYLANNPGGDVYSALLDAAIPQEDADGFSGDEDGFAEPLLNCGSF